MKKKILMALALAAVGLLSIGGTVAFFTDNEESSSVFTVGNVNIALLQDDAVNGVVELMPSVKVDTKTQIKNVGDNDAYVWLTLSIPAALDVDDPNRAYDNILHWNLMGAFWKGYHQKTDFHTSAKAAYPELNYDYPIADDMLWINENVVVDTEEIDGVTYNVYVLKYAGVLEPGETTTPGLSTIFLDDSLDYNEETGKWVMVEKGVETVVNHDFGVASSVIVRAHAIQTENFADFDTAYAAYYAQNDAE